jgi:hypothetical protein
LLTELTKKHQLSIWKTRGNKNKNQQQQQQQFVLTFE